MYCYIHPPCSAHQPSAKATGPSRPHLLDNRQMSFLSTSYSAFVPVATSIWTYCQFIPFNESPTKQPRANINLASQVAFHGLMEMRQPQSVSVLPAPTKLSLPFSYCKLMIFAALQRPSVDSCLHVPPAPAYSTKGLPEDLSVAHKAVLSLFLSFPSISHSSALSWQCGSLPAHCTASGHLTLLAWLTLYSPGPTGSYWFHSCLPFRHKSCRYYIFHSLLGHCFTFLVIQDSFK